MQHHAPKTDPYTHAMQLWVVDPGALAYYKGHNLYEHHRNNITSDILWESWWYIRFEGNSGKETRVEH